LVLVSVWANEDFEDFVGGGGFTGDVELGFTGHICARPGLAAVSGEQEDCIFRTLFHAELSPG
jgi:hypothetical protein